MDKTYKRWMDGPHPWDIPLDDGRSLEYAGIHHEAHLWQVAEHRVECWTGACGNTLVGTYESGDAGVVVGFPIDVLLAIALLVEESNGKDGAK